MKTEELQAAIAWQTQHVNQCAEGGVALEEIQNDIVLLDAARHYHEILPLLEKLIEAREETDESIHSGLSFAEKAFDLTTEIAKIVKGDGK